ncbi:MAG: type II toxin-antitoxin system VapC family toxin [Chloroflexi bacterium]|nr:type II toxin-antitoxin system VapC family toxin [Chloroflexota bacterium]
MTQRCVLDAWAVLAMLQGEEPAATTVRQRLEQAFENEVLLFISIINLGEVIYCIGKVKGEAAGWETLAELRQLPLAVLPATEDAVMAAVAFKIGHAISYADAFAVATTREQGAILLTGDPELLLLGQQIEIEPLHRSG